MRREEKENFRLVMPMMTAGVCDYADIIEGSEEDSTLNVGHCASNAQQLEEGGETGEAATSWPRRRVEMDPP